MTRSLDLVSNRLQQDYLLSLRAGLQHLGESLESMVSQDSTCWPDEAARTAFNTAVSQLNRLVNAGRVNSGYCPFTGKQQTTIGGSEVGSLLRKLAKIRPVAIQHGGQETKKLGRAIGKLLREVRETGNDPDPAGAIPVNWEMHLPHLPAEANSDKTMQLRRTAMFGARVEMYPSSQIHIKFEPAADKKPTEEQVYEVLRRYGQLDELTASGDGYTARFRYVSGGVAARNCLHRAPLQLEGQDGPVTTFCIEYKQFVQKWLWETLTANARFVFPLFVVFMFGTTYFIWDPMRTAFVHLRLAAIFSSVPSRSDSEHREGDSHYTGATGFALRGLHGALRGLREARADWLDQPPERVMLLTGHRGNGLNEMARKLAGHRVLEINVRDMLEVGGAADDHLFLRSFSRSVGYWPAQGMDRQLSAAT
eukprot:s1805_g4.t15